jgi:acetyl esterase
VAAQAGSGTEADAVAVHWHAPPGRTDAAVRLVAWRVAPGSRVARGETLAVLASANETINVDTPVAGEVRARRVAVGDAVHPGDVLCRLTVAGAAPTRTDWLAGDPAQADGMDLTADMRALLDAAAIARIGQPAFFEQTPEAVRRWLAQRFTPYWNRNRAPMRRIEAITVPGGGGPLPARLYDPGVPTPAPTLVYLHGGGWSIGDLDSHDALCRRLAVVGCCRVLALAYRLAPEHPFPAAFEDAVAATAFLARHAGCMGLDPARLVLGGDSAGANLALAATIALRDRDFPLPRALMLLYGPYRFDLETPSWRRFDAPYFLLSREDAIWFWRHYVGHDYRAGDDPRVEPLLAALHGLPPVHLVGCDHDPLWDDALALADALHGAGVACELDRWPGLVHGAAQFFDAVDGAVLGLERCGRFLRATFGPT